MSRFLEDIAGLSGDVGLGGPRITEHTSGQGLTVVAIVRVARTEMGANRCSVGLACKRSTALLQGLVTSGPWLGSQERSLDSSPMRTKPPNACSSIGRAVPC